MVEIKYPRVMVTNKRHALLTKEAKQRKISIMNLAEEKFIKADKSK